MKDTCQDLLAEYRELDALAASLSAAQWREPSAFYGWSAWDEIAHLCYFDQTALQSATEPEAFLRGAQALNALMAAGGHISAVAREQYGHLDGPALLGLDPDATAVQPEQVAAVRSFVAAAIERGELIDVDPDVLLALVGGVALQCGLLIARAPDPDAERAALTPAVNAMLRGLAPPG